MHADRHRDAGGIDAPAPAAPLQARASFGFAVGDFGFNLYWQGLGLFLIFFQTDVLGIPAAWAGVCYLIASIWDGLTDPIMGAIADRTRSRWGKYRPYLLFGSVPLAVAFSMTFWAPPLPMAWLVAYTLATQMIVRALYTTLAIPYSSLSAAITTDSAQRTALTGLRMQCAFLGGIVVAYLMPALAGWLGGTTVRAGYGLAAAAIGAIATLAFLFCYASVREPASAGPEPAAGLRVLSDARGFLRVVRRSEPLLRVLLGKSAITFALTMHTRNIVFYVKYLLGALDAVRYAMPLITTASFLSVPFWVWVIRRSSKRTAWLIGCGATVAFSLCLQAAVHPSLPLAIGMLCAIAAGTTSFAVCFWAMLPDTVEFNELHFGRRDAAKVFGIASFSQKLAMGLSAVTAGVFLEGSGFLANQVQGAQAIDAIRTTMGLVPAVGAALSFLVMYGYALDDGEHRRIVGLLSAARQERDGTP
jgi:GPH family glycoside/pentoside/hexuronide:cation symporter